VTNPSSKPRAARDVVTARAQAYQKTFAGQPAQTVLRDIAWFCRANASTFHADARLAAQLDGRREVWLRIQNHLKMTPDELWDLLNDTASQSPAVRELNLGLFDDERRNDTPGD
jgi:hypothetical protein